MAPRSVTLGGAVTLTCATTVEPLLEQVAMVQSDGQPSPSTRLPSSQVSPASMLPLPQVGLHSAGSSFVPVVSVVARASAQSTLNSPTQARQFAKSTTVSIGPAQEAPPGIVTAGQVTGAPICDGVKVLHLPEVASEMCLIRLFLAVRILPAVVASGHEGTRPLISLSSQTRR